MDQPVIERLVTINREFYHRFADQFANTRGPQQPGLLLLPDFLPRSGRLLDIGCGNGRFALVLEQRELLIDYLGIDASRPLLEIARETTNDLRYVRTAFQQVDVMAENWAHELQEGSFDAIALLAVLHHIPGRQRRRSLLAGLREHLAPSGVLAISTWQFLNSERLKRKIVPWQQIDIDSDSVEPGDYLLDWQRGGSGLRYCHLIDERQLRELAAAAGLEVREIFLADGKEGNLNLFAILARNGP
ncbi:MAG: class I SAM-dependent methyltransferase [Chloroflexota bacterium]|nr:class I SAM-dependent methyltransferase [Chloroflexota bacterium]